MINYDSNYIYLTVPTEYKCVYYNILDVLGTLGRDLLSACTATCKGRAINGIACYNMFNAACAAYYLGQVKLARTLISYIKAQLEINCDNLVIFQDSALDEFIYLKVPVAYETLFENLLSNMAKWGQELLDDCTASCSGNNKNILNAWNLFQAAVVAYGYGNTSQANKIVNFISTSLGISSDTPGGGGSENDTPTTNYYTINVNPTPSDAIVIINGIQTKSLTVQENTTVTVVISKTGYESYSETFTAKASRNINIALQQVQDGDDTSTNVTISITTVPSDAIVTINGNRTKTLSVLKGTPVSIMASKPGYVTQYLPQFIANDSFAQTITLEEEEVVVRTVTLAVIPTPSDAVVRINGQVASSAVLNDGDSYVVEVSKVGYRTVRRNGTAIASNGDIVLPITLEQSTFVVTPTNVDLGYAGGEVQFLAQDDNLDTLGVLMANYSSNPNVLNYYDSDDNLLPNQIGNAITIANFHTVIPQNNTNQTQIYRISARNMGGSSSNARQDIEIVINVAPNPNASGENTIIINGAVDSDTNEYIDGCSYYKNNVLINPAPSRSSSHVITFAANPNSDQGVTIVTKKEGYITVVNNIDYKNGSIEFAPQLTTLPVGNYLFAKALKYVPFAGQNLWTQETEGVTYNLVPYEDSGLQQDMVAIQFDVQSNSEVTVEVTPPRATMEGIEIFNETTDGNGRILITIDPLLWGNDEITIKISNDNMNSFAYVKVPRVDI